MMSFHNNRVLAALLAVVFLMGTFGAFNVNAQRRYRGYDRGGHHSRTKGALIGAAAGWVDWWRTNRWQTRSIDWRWRGCGNRLLDPETQEQP